MNSTINAESAAAHVIEMRRAAEQRRLVVRERDPRAVELRAAHVRDAEALRRLAALDDAAELQGRVLLALIDGDPVAALSLHDGRVVANPFVATVETVALLRLRAEQMGPARARRRLRIPRLRLA